jgi:hypothetical protein
MLYLFLFLPTLAAIHGYRKTLTIKYMLRILREIDVSPVNFYLQLYRNPEDFP